MATEQCGRSLAELYETLTRSKAERFKFLGNSVQYLESLGIVVDESTLARVCLTNEQLVAENSKAVLGKLGNSTVSGAFVI